MKILTLTFRIDISKVLTEQLMCELLTFIFTNCHGEDCVDRYDTHFVTKAVRTGARDLGK